MRYPSIRLEGAVLSGDLIERIGDNPEELRGQRPTDFGIEGSVRDEIANAWAKVRNYYQTFAVYVEDQGEPDGGDDPYGTTATRSTWIVPFFKALGYQPVYQKAAAIVADQTYNISHNDRERAETPLHVVGFREDLDKNTERNRAKLSHHSLVQEYLNLTEEHLFAIVTNGLKLRLLRDASRLIRLSYVEFDLQKMLEEELYADFAILFRLLHASRLPASKQNPADSFMEAYHQQAMEDGTRIRRLSRKMSRRPIICYAGFCSG